MGSSRPRRPRLLRPVGLSDDGLGILLAPQGAEDATHQVRIDGDLVGRLEEARSRLPARSDGTSELSPREIQALLRRGVSVAEVARRAGMPRAWVDRFAAPITWERAGMAERARRAVMVRSRLGPSGLPLGESVRRRLSGQIEDDAFDACWDAIRAEDDPDEWIVSFRPPGRSRTSAMRWAYNPRNDRLRPLDPAAVRYGWTSGLTPEDPLHPSGSGAAARRRRRPAG